MPAETNGLGPAGATLNGNQSPGATSSSGPAVSPGALPERGFGSRVRQMLEEEQTADKQRVLDRKMKMMRGYNKPPPGAFMSAGMPMDVEFFVSALLDIPKEKDKNGNVVKDTKEKSTYSVQIHDKVGWAKSNVIGPLDPEADSNDQQTTETVLIDSPDDHLIITTSEPLLRVVVYRDGRFGSTVVGECNIHRMDPRCARKEPYQLQRQKDNGEWEQAGGIELCVQEQRGQPPLDLESSHAQNVRKDGLHPVVVALIEVIRVKDLPAPPVFYGSNAKLVILVQQTDEYGRRPETVETIGLEPSYECEFLQDEFKKIRVCNAEAKIQIHHAKINQQAMCFYRIKIGWAGVMPYSIGHSKHFPVSTKDVLEEKLIIYADEECQRVVCEAYLNHIIVDVDEFHAAERINKQQAKQGMKVKAQHGNAVLEQLRAQVSEARKENSKLLTQLDRKPELQDYGAALDHWKDFDSMMHTLGPPLQQTGDNVVLARAYLEQARDGFMEMRPWALRPSWTEAEYKKAGQTKVGVSSLRNFSKEDMRQLNRTAHIDGVAEGTYRFFDVEPGYLEAEDVWGQVLHSEDTKATKMSRNMDQPTGVFLKPKMVKDECIMA